MSMLLLILSLVALGFSWNAVRTRPGRMGPWWFAALFTGELAPFQAAGQMGVALGFMAAGWAGGWAGIAGLSATAGSVVLLGVIQWRAMQARAVVERAAAEMTGEVMRLPRIRWARLLRPYPAPPRTVAVVRGEAYGPDPAHVLDRFGPVRPDRPGPVLLQVHGGGWTGGRRDQQARPLMHRMAAAGWVVYSISYRLSPVATFPDHLVDVKRAIAWIREHGPAHGADPSFLAVTGGSAGGQLAALAALTAGQPEYQPGFEHADTTVQACLPFYGVHDLLDKSGVQPKWPYLSRYVMKTEPAENPALWAAASPIRSAHPARPPFLLIHGDADTLVRPGESRRLAAALRAAGPMPVALAEIPGATHGFDVLHSVRTERVVDGAHAVLEHLWRRWRAAGGGATRG